MWAKAGGVHHKMTRKNELRMVLEYHVRVEQDMLPGRFVFQEHTETVGQTKLLKVVAPTKRLAPIHVLDDPELLIPAMGS